MGKLCILYRNLYRMLCTAVPSASSTSQELLCDVQRGQCVLHVASSYGYPQMVKSLLQCKANVDCRDEVCSSLCSHRDSAPRVALIVQTH